MKQISLKVYVSRHPYFIYGISETGEQYTFMSNSYWIKLRENSVPLNPDDLTLIDEDVFYVTE